MKKLNKPFLKWGTISAIVIVSPILATVSCSSTNNETLITGITVKKPIGNITSLEVKDPNKISSETLIKAFDGIQETNINNFNAVFVPIKNTNNEVGNIVLNAKDGFIFPDNKKSIESMTFTTTSDPLNITTKEVQQIDNNLLKEPLSLDALKLAFNGIDENNYGKIEAKLEKVTTTNKTKIVITTKFGYAFGTSDQSTVTTLESNEFLIVLSDITTINEIKFIKNVDILEAKLSLSTLQQAFNGITGDNLNSFEATVEKNTTDGLTFIKLTAKPDFIFTKEGSTTLNSKQFPILLDEIQPKALEYIIYTNLTTSPLDISILQTAFSGVNKDNIGYITSQPQASTTGAIINLQTNNGYIFTPEGATSLNSNEFSAAIPGVDIIEITNSISSSELVNQVSLTTAQKCFSGLNQQIFDNLTFDVNTINNGPLQQLILSPLPGWVLITNSNQVITSNDQLFSNTFTPTT